MTDRSTISRRNVVHGAASVIAAPAVLRVTPANAQSRTIKIGHVSPRTGPLAAFGEADPFILEQIQKLLAPGIQNGGRTYKVEIVSKDSQSNAARASEVAAELILRDKVDLLVAASTPDTTNPVADQAEVNDVPCITTDCPWQAYFFGKNRHMIPEETARVARLATQRISGDRRRSLFNHRQTSLILSGLFQPHP